MVSGQRKFGGAWETRRLGALATFRKGKGIRRTDLRKTGARCVRYGELYTRYRNYVVDPISRIPEDVAAAALRIEKGELLFAGSGETAEEIGTCVAYIGDEPAYAGGDIIVLRAPRQDPVYLAHLMNAPEAVHQKARMAQGNAVVHIRGDHLAEVELPLPPLPEQRAIAAVLMDVDALIGSLEALIEKKRAIKRAAMQQLLTGRTRLPGFEGEWDTRRLGEIAAITMGQSPPSASYNVVGVGLPLIQGKADISGRATVHRTWTSAPSKLCEAGDIVLTVRAPVGAVAIASKDACLGRGVCGLKPLIDSRFLYCALIPLESQWEGVGQGSTFSAADSGQVASFLVAVPSDRSEQRAIAAVLSDMDTEVAALERRLDKTRALKQGMMQQLLTGTTRLPIPDAVTEDELSR